MSSAFEARQIRHVVRKEMEFLELLGSEQKKKGARWSEGMRSYVRKNGSKTQRVAGITSHIASLVNACPGQEVDLTRARNDYKQTFLPLGITPFEGPIEGQKCHTQCYRSANGREHGSYVHDEMRHFLAFVDKTCNTQRVWDPCFLALLVALKRNKLKIMFNEYVLVSNAKFGTAADLIVSDSRGNPVLVELKCTRGPVNQNFSPFAARLAHTGVLDGMPINEYTTAMVQLLIMVEVFRLEYGVDFLGGDDEWEVRAGRAQVFRVGKPNEETSNSLARRVVRWPMDYRVYAKRTEIMTAFQNFAQHSKKRSSVLGKRKRNISRLENSERLKIRSRNRAERKRKFVDQDRPKNGRCKERTDKHKLDLRHHIRKFVTMYSNTNKHKPNGQSRS